MTNGSRGWVAPGFEPVAEAFARNFTRHGELGAAFAATQEGRPVVDLWGGVADAETRRPWREDTPQLIFSGTKGLLGACIAMLVDRGALRLADPVCRYWPEFAAAGKEAITVAEVVSHRARLPAVRTTVAEHEFLDPRRMAELLAAQAPEPDPRLVLAYHGLTIGWLCAELVRRVDGRSVGRFLAEEVAGPLGLDVWIGLPERLEHRVATLAYGPAWGQSPLGRGDAFPEDPLWEAMWDNPPLFPLDDLPWNRRAWHLAEIPAVNAIGTATALARFYGALACGGTLDGVRLMSPATVELAATELGSGVEPYSGELMSNGIVFELQTAEARFGPAAQAFGSTGAGGSVQGVWPRWRVSFAYAMNELRDDVEGDPRAAALLDALHACVA